MALAIAACGGADCPAAANATCFALEDGIDYFEGSSRGRHFGVRLVVECSRLCAVDASCNGFAYDRETHSCYLKRFRSSPVGAARSDFVSGYCARAPPPVDSSTRPPPPVDSSCYAYFPHSDIAKGREDRLNYDTQQECIDECSARGDACSVFVYAVTTGECYLKVYKRSPPEPVYSTRFNSGRKDDARC